MTKFLAILLICIDLSSCGEHAWNISVIPLPIPSGVLRISCRQTHAFLAEYEYKVEVEVPGKKTLSLKLFPQTGGKSEIEVIWYPELNNDGPFILLKHFSGSVPVDELIDLANGAVYSRLNQTESFQDEIKIASRAKPVHLGVRTGP